MKYVGIVNYSGTTTAAAYNPIYIGNAADDLRNDARVENYKFGFNTEQEALDWANAQ